MKAMRYIKLFICLLFCLAYVTVAQAQNNIYVTGSRSIAEDRIDDLNGACGILLISSHDDLVISSVQAEGENKDLMQVKADGQRADGLYEYRVIFDAAASRNPKLEVHRAGDVYDTEIVAVIKPNFLIAYRVEVVSQPIRMDDVTDANDLLKDETAAELEFTTNIIGLQLVYAPELQAKVTTRENPADRNVKITSLIIPLTPIAVAKRQMERTQIEYENWMKQLEQDTQLAAIESNWEKLDALEQQRDAASVYYSELTNVEIYAENSNRLALNISDLRPRAKKAYAVLPLKVTEKVFTTQSEALIDEGARLFGMRKYQDAKATYLQAKQCVDLSPAMKLTLESTLAQCDSCIVYDQLSGQALKEVMRMKREGNASQQELAKWVSATIEYIQMLANVNPSVFYAKRIEMMERLLDEQPLYMKLTVVEWKTLQEGNRMPNVEVWAYYGKERLALSSYESERKFQTQIERNVQDYERLGISDVNGVVEFSLDRKKLPLGIFFCPSKEAKSKINYRSMEELQRQSSGDYMKRQVRLKMFTK